MIAAGPFQNVSFRDHMIAASLKAPFDSNTCPAVPPVSAII